jgi:formate dehydrogenase beta subunit
MQLNAEVGLFTKPSDFRNTLMPDILFSSWGGKIVDNRGKEIPDFQPVDNVSLPEYFKQDKKIKALMGWYGMVLRSPAVNIVDLCREYMNKVREKSCGKCFLCRVGTGVMADALNRICEGRGEEADRSLLQRLAKSISESSKCNIGQSGPVPVIHALEYFSEDFTRAINSKSAVSRGRYISTLTAPCMDACPFHLDIPRYVEHIKEGRFLESLDVIRERLPLAGVLGRVCVRPCEYHCRRTLLDEPISIKYLKRFVADCEFSGKKEPEFTVEPSAKKGSVAIVGAGPAGLTCAYHLARKGHMVTIYERLGEPGGMAAVGIPDYRLPRQILKFESDQIRKLGVVIKYNTTVGKDIMLDQIEEENDAVFIAIGAHLSTAMRVKGEDSGYNGFIPGVKYLLDINEGRDPYPEGKKVVVVGGGNVAIDCVRCSFRVNKNDVNLVYRRTKNEMPADHVEIRDAEEEQVKFHYLTNPTRIIAENGKVIGLECIRMELGEPDESGRRRPVPVEGSEFVIDCDIVVPAIGQTIDLDIIKQSEDIKTTRWGTISVDSATKQSDRPNVFSGGDCETGPGALITACSAGFKAANSIDRLINGLQPEKNENDCFDKFFEAVKIFDPLEKPGLLGGLKQHHLEMLSPEKRKYTFDEVEQGFSPQEAMAEADRCLRCYRIATVAV